MRTLMKVRMVDVEKANRAAADGSLTQMVQEVMERLHPEAAYFAPEGGIRTAYMVFDLGDPSEMPAIAEPFFQRLNAMVEFQTVMNRDELQAGLTRVAERVATPA
jgi:hypothetical protein